MKTREKEIKVKSMLVKPSKKNKDKFLLAQASGMECTNRGTIC